MSRGKRVKPEQIIAHLRQVEVLLGQGKSLDEACRQIEIHRQTYYRWKKEYGGMEVSQAKRLKELEQENSRLKRIVADQALDNAMLKELATGKW
jgi:putative transposase